VANPGDTSIVHGIADEYSYCTPLNWMRNSAIKDTLECHLLRAPAPTGDCGRAALCRLLCNLISQRALRGGGGTYFNNACTVSELSPEQHVGIIKQAVLQTDHNKLRILEPILEQLPDMLGMGEIESGIDFVQNVHWSGFELEQGHNQGEGDEGSLSAAEFCQALLPDGTNLNLDLEPSCDVAAFRIL